MATNGAAPPHTGCAVRPDKAPPNSSLVQPQVLHCSLEDEEKTSNAKMTWWNCKHCGQRTRQQRLFEGAKLYWLMGLKPCCSPASAAAPGQATNGRTTSSGSDPSAVASATPSQTLTINLGPGVPPLVVNDHLGTVTGQVPGSAFAGTLPGVTRTPSPYMPQAPDSKCQLQKNNQGTDRSYEQLVVQMASLTVMVEEMKEELDRQHMENRTFMEMTTNTLTAIRQDIQTTRTELHQFAQYVIQHPTTPRCHGSPGQQV